MGATEMLFNLYNKKYIAFFCSITRRGVSVFLAMWRGIATRMEAGFVFSELARLQFPFTFSLTYTCSIRSKAVCNSLYSSYLNLHPLGSYKCVVSSALHPAVMETDHVTGHL